MESRELLKHYNIKYTKQRVAILSVLQKYEHPLDPQQIQRQLDVKMDLSTIYRTLDIFVAKQLVTKTLHLELRKTVYNFRRFVHGHHLICTHCGSIKVVKDCPLQDYEQEISHRSGFKIDHHQLELYGLCPRCQHQSEVRV